MRTVPLSWVPPQKRAGICGTVAIEVNCAIARFVRYVTPALSGSTPPFRFTHVTALSGSDAFGRPPRSSLYQTPPSEPISTCEVSAGLIASAW